ncbi:MAG: hypothetical protein JSW11_05250 [Candidatus Heimdallarchaeota archaeon]|nr:MAG: hypothetical protein JSW11_05250 [Candidatus Heimdallarchaeota archaeon]
MNRLICPNCSIEMDFITFLKAPTPWHLKCNMCNAKLRLKKYRRASLIIATVYGTILGLFLVFLLFYFDNIFFYLLYCAVTFIFAIVLFEVIGYALAKKLDVGLELRDIS